MRVSTIRFRLFMLKRGFEGFGSRVLGSGFRVLGLGFRAVRSAGAAVLK